MGPSSSTSKEPCLAFLPTSNDALHSVGFFDSIRPSSMHNERRQQQQFRSSHRDQSESAVFSPSLASEMSSQSHTPGGSHNIQRQHVASASAMPNTSAYTDGPDPADDTFWYNLHLETLDNFDRERATWKKMTDRLRNDIDKLKAQLLAVQTNNPQHDSRQDSAFYSLTGKENDKVFFDANTVCRANEKLREFSVVSPRGQSSTSPAVATPDTVQSNGGSGARKTSGTNRLPSIFEGGSNSASPTMQKRVSIAEPSRSSMFPTEEIPTLLPEDPTSPPTTACPPSPPPPEYIADAGHTPRESVSARNSFVSEQKTRSIRNNSLAWGFDNASYFNKKPTIDGEDAIEEEEEDDDPSLHSPKFLPTTPGLGDDEFMLALDGKLEQIARHPEGNEPEVCKGPGDVQVVSPVPGGELAVELEVKEEGEVVGDLGRDGDGGGEGEGEEEVDVPIRFNRKRSLNFGSQMGVL